ncbi:MAG: PAS domain S-box protein [Verrucomicrobiota bacterium]
MLVNDKREALHIFGEASRFLRSPSGRVSHDVITLCEGDLRVAVSSALQSCLKRSERVALREVQITLPGGDKGIIDVVAEPVLDRATNSTFVFVKFLEERKPRQHDGAHALVLDDEVKGRVMQLESELQGTRESLQTMVEELETTNEELQASNEELLASNEELQSTNEELHSVNEELYSVNAEHEQKIRELAATTADLRNLIAVTHTGIVFIDRQHCIRLFTPGAAQLLNLMPQDVGRPIAHITSRIKGDDIFDDLRLADETRQPLEKAITTADGAHFLRRITPYHDADKQHNGMVVSFTDITAMTRVEAEKRTLINAIIDTSPAHKAVIDESGVIQATNRTWEQFTRTHGLGPQATGIGASYFEACAAIFGDANAAQVTGHIREVLSGQRERADFDYPCGPPNQDQWFWMTVSRFTHNHSVGAVITHTNITSRKISERALADAASRFRTMHDNMPIGMLTIDDQAIIRHANPSALKLLGYPEDELVGLHLETCIHEPQRKNHRQHFAAFMKAPMTRIMSGRSMLARRKDGSSFAAEIGISPAEFDGERFIMTFISDVTERNRIADEKLHIQRKLEETAKLESLGVLAGGIAHDFNNILTGILGNTEVAQQQLPKGSPLHPCLTDVITACLRASDLCKQMLAYAGKGRFILQHSDLSALVRETTSLIRLSISKKTSLHLELADGLPRVEIDESQIRQVVMNLVINASESFGDKAGDIHIRTGRARGATDGSGTLMIAHEGAADDFAYLEVEDNGCGISPENLKRIFDPFFTTKFVGRGLGLAAVQGIVRSHKGMLGVQSKVGQGTKFRLLLPCALTTVTESPAPPAAPASITRSGRILLVDDEPIVLITSRRILEHAGYQCLTANTGSEAVQLLSTTPDHIDLVVLDLTMPGISGGKTYELMRELRPHLKVILSSGYNENEAIAQFGDGELAGFLPKPVSAQLLLNMVNTALSSAAPEENKGMVHISHPQSASATNQ